MTVLGQTNLISANTVYMERGSEVFSRPQEGFWQLYCDVQNVVGQQFGLEVIGPSPAVEELVGNRRVESLREYLKEVVIKTYTTPMLELDSTQVEGDATGAMAKRLVDYLASGPFFWDKIATDTLLSNPTCIDGEELLDNSHPHASGGGTWDNLVTDALTFTSYDAAKTAMKKFTGENGEPLGITPTHLMVGPGLERTAKEIIGADRPVFVGTAGEAASAITAATVIANVYQGDVTLIVNRRMTDDQEWLLMDLSKPGVRPLAFGELQAPRAVAVTDPSSEPMRLRSKYAYYQEGKGGFGGFIPQCIYGRLD